MDFFKKNSLVLLGLATIILYFITRFYNILGLPIFTDEAIYVRWAQIASNDASWRFISLTDGKQPLYVWIAMIFIRFISDPLMAGRVVSVFSGFASIIGLFFLTNEVFKSKKIALLASFIYVLYPFSLVYDRMALYDSLVSMFIIWSLYFEILLVKHLRFDLSLILGMIIGGGMLTKTNANFAFILLPFLLLLFNFKDKNWKINLGKLALFSFVALVISQLMYSILRLSPFFHIIEDKNYVFVYPFSEWIMHPFTYLFNNLSALINWLIIYMTIPFIILVLSSFLLEKKFLKEKLLLFAWFIVPFVISALFFKQPYPRHILFMTLPLLILGAYALYNMLFFARKMWLKIIILIVFFSTFIINDYFIITDFARASVPRSDMGQYITGWPSGVGVKETVSYLKEKSKTEKIYVGTEGTFGLMPFAIEMYFVNNPNVTVKGFWPISENPPEEAIEASKKMPTYFIFYQSCPSCKFIGIAPVQWNMKKIIQIQRIEADTFYTLYQIQSK